MQFVFPAEGYHSAILGTTGSGKSTLAAYILSRAPFHLRPQLILDYKYETIFAKCSRIREIGLHEKLPRDPGVYIMRPLPSDKEGVEDWFEKIWHHENAGLYIDEATLAPDKAWLPNLLAQGRSKNITVIAASQRPVDVPRSIFTEAAYVSVFRLNDRKDVQRVQEFTPSKMPLDWRDDDWRLPDFHCYWYSPKHHKAGDPRPYAVLSPVPGEDHIIETIESRLTPRHRMI